MTKSLRSDYINDPEYQEFLRKGNYQKAIFLLENLHPSSSILIVHDNDPDGCCANALLRMYLTRYSDIKMIASLPISHGEAFKNLDLKLYLKDQQSTLIVLDHEVDMETHMVLLQKVKNLLVIDHHIETSQIKDPNSVVISTTRYSTTALTDGLLTTRLLKEKISDGTSSIPAPPHYRVTRGVNHYDCFLFGEDPEYDRRVKAFAAEVFNVTAPNVNWESLLGDTDVHKANIEKYLSRGFNLIDHQDRVCQKIIEKNMVRMFYHDETQGKLSFGMIFHSDCMDILAQMASFLNPDLDFIAIVYLKSEQEKNFKVSLRSHDRGADVQRIAKSIGGGGGHKHASGVEVSFLDFSKFIVHSTKPS